MIDKEIFITLMGTIIILALTLAIGAFVNNLTVVRAKHDSYENCLMFDQPDCMEILK